MFLSGAAIVGAEGVILGLATTLCEGTAIGVFAVPGLVAMDVASSMTLLTRNICQIATSYGYSSQNPANLPHILAAMSPHHHSDENGFIFVKGEAIKAMHEARQFMIKNVGGVFTDEILSKQAPSLLKLINMIAQRLGIIMTEKELAMLAPIAGCVLGGGVNVAFQQASHTTAKNYFRQLVLGEKYGDDIVEEAINAEIALLKKVS